VTTLIWHAPMQYLSSGDEMAFFAWVHSIPGVVGVRGLGRELHIRLKSKRLSQNSLREFIALYHRYRGDLAELAQFANSSNESWFCSPEAVWHAAVFVAPRNLTRRSSGPPSAAAELKR
jgi:hypothetical protein